jgi:FAD synthase
MRRVAERQPIAELWVGSDFALGRGRRGTIAVLNELGSAAGWGLHIVPPYRLEGQVVSSTAIRTLLSAGAVRGAADLLGRPYTVPGTLLDHRFNAEQQRALPRGGAYEVLVHHEDGTTEAEATVLSTPGQIEVDASAPLPSGPARLEFVRRSD